MTSPESASMVSFRGGLDGAPGRENCPRGGMGVARQIELACAEVLAESSAALGEEVGRTRRWIDYDT